MLGFTLTLCGIAAVMVVATLHKRAHTRRIAAIRAGETFETFRSSFVADEVPESVLRAVYAKFQEWESCFVNAFPVRGDDVIADIYGIADEDLDDMIVELLSQCGRRFPPEDAFRSQCPVTIATVADVARFVAACPKIEGVESRS